MFLIPDLENLTETGTLNISSRINDITMTRIVFAISKNEMYLADTIRLPISKEHSHLCHLSSNLKNTGNYYIRDCFFTRIKHNYKPKMDYGKIKYLGYYKLWRIVKNSKDYKALPPKSAQQTLLMLEHDWKSYRENLNAWREERARDPNNCREKPQIPYYNRRFNRETVTVFTNQQCKIVDGWLIFPKKGRMKSDPPWLPPIKTRFNSLGAFHQVRVVPRGSCYDIEIIYSVPKQDLRLDKSKAIALDLGSTNLLSTANNCGLRPFIVKGEEVKAINQEYNKLIKRYQTVEVIKEQFLRDRGRKPKWNEIKKLLPEYKTERQLKRALRWKFYRERKRCPSFDELNELYNAETGEDLQRNDKKIVWTMQMYRILAKRNNRIKDILHKVSKNLITYCISNNIGTIFIGHNKGWKQNINIGRKNNQKFVSIPFNKLIQKIRYKAKLVGINVIILEESHTSKCSAIDNETIGHHEKYLGRRVKRGQFVSSSGYRINADVNAAFNILRLGLEMMGLLFSPIVNVMLWSPRPVQVNPIA